MSDAARLGRGLNIALANKPPEWVLEDPSACRNRGRAFGPGAYTGRAQRPLATASAPRSVARMDPDATYKSILSYAIMVEELMHWLVADRHGMHALVDALDFSTLTRMHEQSVSDAGAVALHRHSNDMVWRVHLDVARTMRSRRPGRRTGALHRPGATEADGGANNAEWRADPRFAGDGYVLLDSLRVRPEDLRHDNAAALLAGLENPLRTMTYAGAAGLACAGRDCGRRSFGG